MRPYRYHILPTALTLALIGCAGLKPPAPLVGITQQTPVGSSRVVLHVQVEADRTTQAVRTPYTASSIARLDVVPYVEVSPGTFQALSASTGAPTDSTDPAQQLRVSQASPSIDVTQPIVLDRLSANTTYRFYARAYDLSGQLISSDANSYVQLVVGQVDRPTIGDLPIQLVDQTFAGSTTVSLVATGASGRLHHVTTNVFTVADGVELELASSAATTSFGLHPDTLALSNLQKNTKYRVRATAFDSNAAVLATGSVDVDVTNDDTPAPVTLSLAIPSEPAASPTPGPTPSPTPDPDPTPSPSPTPSPTPSATPTPALGGIMNTFAGLGAATADGESPLNTDMSGIANLWTDASGNLFYSDSTRVRVIPAADGTLFGKPMTAGKVYTLIGGGASGLPTTTGWPVNSPTSIAMVAGHPHQMVTDSLGNLYFAHGSACILMLPNVGGTYFGQAMYANKLYKIAGVTNPVTTAKTGDNVTATSDCLSNPYALSINSSGDLFITDLNGLHILPASSKTLFNKTMTLGKIYRLTTTSSGNAINSAGEVLSIKVTYTTTTNTTIEKYGPSTGTATTLFTSNTIGAGSLFVDSADNLFVVGDGSSDTRHRVAIYPQVGGTKYGMLLTPSTLSLIAGSTSPGSTGDGGPAKSAKLNGPSCVTVGPDGTLYIGDRSNAKIRMVTP